MNVNLNIDFFQSDDANLFVDTFAEAPPAPSTVKQLYIGSTQATNVVYVDGVGSQNSNIQIYLGSTKVWG